MNFKKEFPLILIALIPFLYLSFIWTSLPEKVPLHWNAAGIADRWGGKAQLLMIPFLLPVLVYAIFSITPILDPKRKIQYMGNKYYQLKFLIVLIMSVLATFILYATKRQSFFSPNTIIMLAGLLFAVLGNYLPTLKPNYFIGIRTPWTLENETVWKKTHQLAGKFWFPGGLLIIILTFIIKDLKILHTSFIVITIVIAVIPMIYSYFAYKRI